MTIEIYSMLFFVELNPGISGNAFAGSAEREPPHAEKQPAAADSTIGLLQSDIMAGWAVNSGRMHDQWNQLRLS